MKVFCCVWRRCIVPMPIELFLKHFVAYLPLSNGTDLVLKKHHWNKSDLHRFLFYFAMFFQMSRLLSEKQQREDGKRGIREKRSLNVKVQTKKDFFVEAKTVILMRAVLSISNWLVNLSFMPQWRILQESFWRYLKDFFTTQL